jgi:hypothetical protein
MGRLCLCVITPPAPRPILIRIILAHNASLARCYILDFHARVWYAAGVSQWYTSMYFYFALFPIRVSI